MTDTATKTTTWTIDTAHSVLEFAVKHMMFTTAKGRFQEFGGTIEFDPQNVESASVEVVIQTASIDTNTADRDGHLRSADFFDVERFPTAAFRSTRVDPKGGDDFRIIGDLTIKDITREVELDATFQGTGVNPMGAQVAGFEARGIFSRKDFGLTWNHALESGGVLVSDEVRINLEIQAGMTSPEA